MSDRAAARRSAASRRGDALVIGEVSRGNHAQRPAGRRGQVDMAFVICWIGVEQFGRQHSLGQVVDPAPAGPPRADHVPGVQQPLDGDLGVRPVPPGSAVLRPAQLGRRQWPLGSQPGQDVGADAGVALMPAQPPGAEPTPPERVVRPLLDRQYAGRVRPVFEGTCRIRVPVGTLDLRPRNRA